METERSRGKLVVMVLAVFGLSLLAFAGSAKATLSVKFVSPKTDRLVTSPRVKLDIRTSRPASSMKLEVRGRKVTSRFKRVGPVRWTAEVKRSQLAPGGNDLTAFARTKSGDRAFTVIRIFRGSPSPGLLGLSILRTSSGPAQARMKLKSEPDLLLRARLNGKSATSAFRPLSVTTRKARLSPDDGLRYGLNRLRVSVAKKTGAYSTRTRTFRIPRTRPLAAAGKDRTVRAARRVKLNGASSRATAKRGKLTYRWKFAARPVGSKPKLLNRTSRKPILRLDRPGTYRVQLTVRQKGSGTTMLRNRNARDTVTITNGKGVTPLGLPLTTIANPGGDDLGMSYDGQLYPADFTKVTAQLLIIDRVSGTVIKQKNYAGTSADATNAISQIKAAAAQDPLVILSSSGLGADPLDPSFNNVVKLITGTTLRSGVIGSDGFSAIGIPGSPGAAWLNAGLSGLDFGDLSEPPGTFDGYLQLDNTGHLAFTPKQRIKLDSSAPGAPAGQNTIQVGENLYPSGPLESPTSPGTPCGTGGFQVQAATAEFLDTGPGQTFTTNGCGASEDTTGQQQMAQFLSSSNLFNGQGAQLVVIQSIGQPRGANDSNWGQLTDAITAIGGNEYLFDMPTQAGESYAIVGSSSPVTPMPDFPVVESSSQETDSTAHITAVLKQGRAGYLEARQASPTDDSFEFDLSLLAYQPENGPAFPNASTAEELEALEYIADQVLDLPAPQAGTSCYVPYTPDVRSEYCNPDVTDRWGSTDEDGYTYKFTSATYPGASAGFSEDVWNALRCDFLGLDCGSTTPADEWGSIQQIWSDFNQLKLFILGNSSLALADASLTAQQIRSSISTVSPNFEVRWLDIFANILSGVSYLGIEGLGDPVGLISTAGLLAEDALNSPAGNPLLGKFDTTAAVYLADLSAALTGSFGALDHSRNIILTSQAKMLAMANGDFVPGNLSQAIPAVTLGVARFSYHSLLPAAYEPVELPRYGVNTGVTSAKQYQCGAADLEVGYNPFPDEPTGGQWLPAGGDLYAVVKKGSPLPDGLSRVYPDTPPSTLMDPLFKPYATDSTNLIPTQFAFYPDSFFPSIFDIPKAPSLSC